MNIAVCYDESLIRQRLDQMGDGHYLLSRLDTYETAEELLESPESYDLVLVDGGAWREMQRASERSRDLTEAPSGAGRASGKMPAEEHSAKKASGYLRICTRQQSRRIPTDSILYAENDRKKIILHTDSETIEYVATMRELEKQLGSGFFRCHRGYLINLSRVSDHSSDMILMDNGEQVYLSRRKLSDFEARLRRR